jgi:hypothetical protein
VQIVGFIICISRTIARYRNKKKRYKVILDYYLCYWRVISLLDVLGEGFWLQHTRKFCDCFVHHLKFQGIIIIFFLPKTLLSRTEIRHAPLCVHVIFFLSVTVLIIRMTTKLVSVVTRQNSNFVVWKQSIEKSITK